MSFGFSDKDNPFHPFEYGAMYLVKSDFTHHDVIFKFGDVLEFRGSSEGWYDTVDLFRFVAPVTGEEHILKIFQNESLQQFLHFFQKQTN